jgi:hypothetical protein
VADSLSLIKLPSFTPSFILGILKLFSLILVFYLGMRFLSVKTYELVLCYIFQLIILVISTKKDLKNS